MSEKYNNEITKKLEALESEVKNLRKKTKFRFPYGRTILGTFLITGILSVVSSQNLTSLNIFQQGDTISAQQVNQNFGMLDQKINNALSAQNQLSSIYFLEDYTILCDEDTLGEDNFFDSGNQDLHITGPNFDYNAGEMMYKVPHDGFYQILSYLKKDLNSDDAKIYLRFEYNSLYHEHEDNIGPSLWNTLDKTFDLTGDNTGPGVNVYPFSSPPGMASLDFLQTSHYREHQDRPFYFHKDDTLKFKLNCNEPNSALATILAKSHILIKPLNRPQAVTPP